MYYKSRLLRAKRKVGRRKSKLYVEQIISVPSFFRDEERREMEGMDWVSLQDVL